MRYARRCGSERTEPEERTSVPSDGPDHRRLLGTNTGSLLHSADGELRGRAVRSLQQAEHQNDQNAIDPFIAVLNCPAPAGGQGSP